MALRYGLDDVSFLIIFLITGLYIFKYNDHSSNPGSYYSKMKSSNNRDRYG